MDHIRKNLSQDQGKQKEVERVQAMFCAFFATVSTRLNHDILKSCQGLGNLDLCAWQDDGADPPRNHAKAHG